MKRVIAIIRCFVILFFVVLLMCLAVSCDNKKTTLLSNVIPLENAVGNYNILNFSDYATDIKYIPLETNDSVLMGRILQISYENGMFLIRSSSEGFSSECYLFDNKGRFCCKIGNYGQGPDDYYGLVHAFIMENRIYLMDIYGNKLFIYDTNGVLIENNNLRRIKEINSKKKEYDLSLQIFPLKKDTFVLNVGSSYGYYPTAILLNTQQSTPQIIKEYPNYAKIDMLGGITCSFDELGGVALQIGRMRAFSYRGEYDTILDNINNDAIFIYTDTVLLPAGILPAAQPIGGSIFDESRILLKLEE